MRCICLLWISALLAFSLSIVEAQQHPSPFYLPDINIDVDFELEHVFKSHQREGDQPQKDMSNTNADQSMLLIGTLINDENRVVWIKTHELHVHELSEGQRVPGSTLRVDRIYTDSVELVDDEQCQQVGRCDPQFVLELN